MIAVCLIRDGPHYRRDAFVAGLTRAGYTLRGSTYGFTPGPADLLVIWNRYGPAAEAAMLWERTGGNVAVCENGYYGCDEQRRQHYSIALRGHNGSGLWPRGDGTRLAMLGITFATWRADGDHILICPQRGIGPPPMRMPSDWPDRISRQLRGMTNRPLKIRPHPAQAASETTLAEDLRGAWAMATWSSNAATQALIAGVPVLYCGPHIVTAGAAVRGVEFIERPLLPNRIPAFERMAWAQWSVEEIEAGEPFEYLRDLAHQQRDGVQSIRGGIERAHRTAGAAA